MSFFLHSSTHEVIPKCTHPIEDSEKVVLISSSPISSQRSLSYPSVTFEPQDEDQSEPQSVVENVSDSETWNPTTVLVTSPSYTSHLHSEQNDSIDSLNSSSTSFLQTSQRRIDHRRNRSEPVKSLSTEDLHSSISNNARDEDRRKSSTKLKQIADEKTPPSSTTISRKKKAWYNVSEICRHGLYTSTFSCNASMSQSLCKRMLSFFVLSHSNGQ